MRLVALVLAAAVALGLTCFFFFSDLFISIDEDPFPNVTDVPMPTEQPATVPFERTPYSIIEPLIRLADIGPATVFFDLGCGDGRVVQAIARRTGARTVCVERRRDLLVNASIRIRQQESKEVQSRIEFIPGDIFTVDVSSATVVYIYLIPDVVKALTPRLFRDVAVGTVIVSHDYRMEPHESIEEWWSHDKHKVPISGSTLEVLAKYVVGVDAASGERISAMPYSDDGKATFSMRKLYNPPYEFQYRQIYNLAGHGPLFLCVLGANNTAKQILLQGAADPNIPHLKMSYYNAATGVYLGSGRTYMKKRKSSGEKFESWLLHKHLALPLQLSVKFEEAPKEEL